MSVETYLSEANCGKAFSCIPGVMTDKSSPRWKVFESLFLKHQKNLTVKISSCRYFYRENPKRERSMDDIWYKDILLREPFFLDILLPYSVATKIPPTLRGPVQSHLFWETFSLQAYAHLHPLPRSDGAPLCLWQPCHVPQSCIWPQRVDGQPHSLSWEPLMASFNLEGLRGFIVRSSYWIMDVSIHLWLVP